jgi:pimeloyl-ACP methyl ester carboxylesterase
MEAVQAGDLEAAKGWFATAVRADPSSEQGWLMLATCLTEQDRVVYCLQRVLALNPNNVEARSQLDRLSPPPAAAPTQAEVRQVLSWPRGARVSASPPLPTDIAPEPAASQKAPFAAPAAPSPADDGGSGWSPLKPPVVPASFGADFASTPFSAEDLQRPAWADAPLPKPDLSASSDRPAEPPPAAVPEKPGGYRRPFDDPEPTDRGLPFFASQPQPSVIPAAVDEAMPAATPPPAVPVKRKKSKRLWRAVLIVGIIFLAEVALGVGYMVLSAARPALFDSVLAPTARPKPTSPADLAATPQTGITAAPASTATALPTPLPTVSYTPSFEITACPFQVPRGAQVTCGYLVVPEDRAGDPAHTIRLAVAVYHSTSSAPESQPVLFLQGGPGGEAVKLSANNYSVLVAPFLKQRDFIAYDQRGTGLSEPALNCDELTKAYLQDIHGQIPADARKLVYQNAFISCQGLMSAKGIDLNAYTTVASAADVRDLLSTLKVQQVDLYGASYGTRLAQVIMRDDPGIVHAAILDSVVPIEANFFYQYPDAIQSALDTLFESCAADSGCKAAYPDLKTVFWDEVARLDAKPVTLTIAGPSTGSITESVDGSVFLSLILGSLKQSSLIATAPQTIYRFKAGDYSAVLAAESSLPLAFQDISAGLYISMMCHENILATTPDQLQAAMGGPSDIRESAWLPFYGSAQDVYQACQSWQAVGPRLGENNAVSSDIPALILAGKYDPSTPPKYARQVQANLSRSYYFEFPNQGHTPTAADASGCAMSMAVAFLSDPLTKPDGSCVDGLPQVPFVLPYTGSPPVELKDAATGGISAQVPRGWTSLGDGFYLRGNSPFDITQVGITSVPGTTSAALLNWISMKAWGYRGFDSAPVWTSQRQANALDWNLYTSTSYGRPVDIAMADHNGGSIVILVFSNIDEHDAIYRTVFLPILDSVGP